MNKSKKSRTNITFVILDLFSLLFSFVLSYYIRHHNFNIFNQNIYKEMFLIMIVVNVLLVFIIDIYNDVVKRNKYEEIERTFVFDLLSFAITIIYLFIIKTSSSYSRLTIFLTYIFYFIISLIIRLIWKRHIRNKAKTSTKNGNKSLLVICKEKDAENIIKKIRYNNYDYYYISGLCIVDKKEIGNQIKGYNVVSDLNNILSFVSTNWIDDILIASGKEYLSKEIIDGLKSTGITLHIALNEILDLDDKKQYIDTIGGFNVLTAKNIEYDAWQILIKRIMDIIGGIIGTIITLLLTIIVGPIIYIKSPGNIFYVSDRIGKNGKKFRFYKFRSMIINADEMKESLQDENKIKSGLMFKIENDPRIIPGIGSFIRKTSIDEFPQFINVLKGDMSLVGTRPPTTDEWEKYDPYYRSRLSIKPGITGMWQISGRSNITDFDEVVKLDNEYINNWSLLLDIKILLVTILNLFIKKDDAL